MSSNQWRELAREREMETNERHAIQPLDENEWHTCVSVERTHTYTKKQLKFFIKILLILLYKT